MNAHVPTLFLMQIAISATLALSVGLVARAQRHDGMVFWAASLACNTAVYVLFMLRGQISDWVSIVLANVLVACVFALSTEGILQFQGRRPRRWLIWGPVPLTAVLFAALMPLQSVRMVVGSVLFSMQLAVIVVSLLQCRKTTAGVGQYCMMAGFLLMIVAFMVQLVGTLLRMGQVTTIMTPHPVQTMMFMVATLSVVVVSLGLVVMIKERAEDRNLNLAMRDELTGLLSRRFLLESLEQHLSAAKRNRLPLTLLTLDIDFFKRVNDTYGHLAGDQVLKAVASVLAQRTRAQDVLGRMGGEEFMVVLPNTTGQGAWQLAENLRQGVAATPFYTLSGDPMIITVSIGLCEVSQLPDPQSDDLMAAADQALYAAKAAGRNRVEVFASQPQAAGH